MKNAWFRYHMGPRTGQGRWLGVKGCIVPGHPIPIRRFHSRCNSWLSVSMMDIYLGITVWGLQRRQDPRKASWPLARCCPHSFSWVSPCSVNRFILGTRQSEFFQNKKNHAGLLACDADFLGGRLFHLTSQCQTMRLWRRPQDHRPHWYTDWQRNSCQRM